MTLICKLDKGNQMAVHGIEDLTETTGSDFGGLKDAFNESGIVDEAGVEEVAGSVEVFGLTSTSLLSSTSLKDDEYLRKFTEIALNATKDGRIKIDVLKLNKSQYNLEYSFLTFAHKGKNGKAYIFTILLEETGRPPVRLEDIVDDLQNKYSTNIFVSSDMFNEYLMQHVNSVVYSKYGAGVEIVNLDGEVIPTGVDIEVTADITSRIIHDILYMAVAIDEGIGKDITINDLLTSNEFTGLQLDLSYTQGGIIDKLGKTKHADFMLEGYSLLKNDMQRFGITAGAPGMGARKEISTLTGAIDFTCTEIVDNFRGNVEKVIYTDILLKDFLGNAPTIGYMLLNLINSSVFTDINNLFGLIVEKDAGPLNFYINHKGDTGSVVGPKVSFKDGTLSPEDIGEFLNTYFRHSPRVVVDVELYGSDYTYAAAFAALGTEADASANQYIINESEKVTGLPMTDVNGNVIQVAATEPFDVPVGVFIMANDKDAVVHDLSEIDSTFIAKYSNNINLLYGWGASNTSVEDCLRYSGKTNYMLKLDIYRELAAELGLSIKITSKSRRIVLSAEYLSTLVMNASATRKDIKKSYSPVLEGGNPYMASNTNLQALSEQYQRAGVSNISVGVRQQRGGVQATMPNFTPLRRW